MSQELILYISAASDLLAERHQISRAIAEIPADLRWHIVQSPIKEGEVDQIALQNAFAHFLLIGGDIRAPIGFEYVQAKQSGRLPTCLLKTGINRTAAAVDFQKHVSLETHWERFADSVGLRKKVLEHVGQKLLKSTMHIGLTASEYDQIAAWLDQMENA
ncbi:MAG: hypothetical protein AAGD96_16735, partial [Chloroflexota bacterium]